jgi:hypothetical protein
MRPALSPPTVPYHDMQKKLAVEETYKPRVHLVFMPHRVDDISSSLAERKSGTDFLLHPRNSDGTHGAPIRCENKFEEYCTGRQLFELVSVDRPTYSGRKIVPGWLYTSRTAWLLSWYLSGEMIALPMDEVRDMVLANPVRHQATTARNKTYLSWSALEDMNYVVQNVPNARWLDLAYETGQVYAGEQMLRGASLEKQCSADDLVDLMRRMPAESTPRAVSQEQLIEQMQALAPLDRKRLVNKDMRAALPWL